MSTETLGLVELIGSFLIFVALLAWQFWSLRRDNKRAADEKLRRQNSAPGERER
jgi:hypothetical protein